MKIQAFHFLAHGLHSITSATLQSAGSMTYVQCVTFSIFLCTASGTASRTASCTAFSTDYTLRFSFSSCTAHRFSSARYSCTATAQRPARFPALDQPFFSTAPSHFDRTSSARSPALNQHYSRVVHQLFNSTVRSHSNSTAPEWFHALHPVRQHGRLTRTAHAHNFLHGYFETPDEFTHYLNVVV